MIDSTDSKPKIKEEGFYPLLPLRGVVVFPGSLIQLFVGRDRSIAAVKQAIETDNIILLSCQLDIDTDSPSKDDLYEVGTLANIIRIHNQPDGTIRVTIEGRERFTLVSLEQSDNGYLGEYRLLTQSHAEEEVRQHLIKLLVTRVQEFLQYRKQPPSDQLIKVLEETTNQSDKLFDFIVNLMPFRLDEKYNLLATNSEKQRFELFIEMVEAQIELQQVDEKINNRIRKQISQGQRTHYLNEQMKAIQQEMSELDEDSDPLTELEKSIDKVKMSKEATVKAKEELSRLRKMPSMSAEATVLRNYLDTLISLPWHKKSRMNSDMARAKTQLDNDHYALQDVKDRILEYIAVCKRAKNLRAPVLCLVGPPGVGKTSLAKSIAKASGRKFIRLSLGGVRDEAEIRGHRRTYIGSMPGRIIEKMAKTGTINPLFLFDEIDKMGKDFRGDPASALLEVLDPEQNKGFNDHYLDVDYDLSQIMFICTSNSMNIPEALLDRLEVIHLSGYTETEKLHIARNHLVTKQLQEHAVTTELEIDDSTIISIIRHYTREAGVRELERKIAKIIRRFVFRLENNEISKDDLPWQVTPEHLTDFIGVEKFTVTTANAKNQIGIVNGLAWTKFGGEILKIETLIVKGKGEFVMTGSLGDVMKESVRAAMSLVRSKLSWLDIPEDFFSKNHVHIHIPEGATPKDGPSAGVAMCTALFSLLSQIPVRDSLAMTGEVTISGNILPIGGLKEKVLAAQRSGITKVLIPTKNAKDLDKIPQEVREQVECIPVETIDEILQHALERFDKKWLMVATSTTDQNLAESGARTH